MLIRDRDLNRNLGADRDQSPNLKADQGPVRSPQDHGLEVDLVHIRRPDQQANLPKGREGRELGLEQIARVVEVELDPDHVPGLQVALEVQDRGLVQAHLDADLVLHLRQNLVQDQIETRK